MNEQKQREGVSGASMPTVQIKITEVNEWEGETFSYILDLLPDDIIKIKAGIEGCDSLSLQEGTNYTPEQINRLNVSSKNGYMDRYGFYTINKMNPIDWHDDVFYKANGLTRIRF